MCILLNDDKIYLFLVRCIAAIVAFDEIRFSFRHVVGVYNFRQTLYVRTNSNDRKKRSVQNTQFSRPIPYVTYIT